MERSAYDIFWEMIKSVPFCDYRLIIDRSLDINVWILLDLKKKKKPTGRFIILRLTARLALSVAQVAQCLVNE